MDFGSGRAGGGSIGSRGERANRFPPSFDGVLYLFRCVGVRGDGDVFACADPEGPVEFARAAESVALGHTGPGETRASGVFHEGR